VEQRHQAVRSIYIEHRALVQGQSVKVDYSLDGGTVYYPAGVSSIAGATGKTFTLDNVTGESLKLKVTLSGPGTSTPTQKKLVARAIPVTDAKWMWDIRLLVRRNWDGAASLAALEQSVKRRRQLDFEDRDGSTYKVIIDNLTIEADPDPKLASAHVKLRLREV
jgi:hypothetical protein